MTRHASRAAATLICLLSLALSVSPASAALRLCNLTSYVLYAATGEDGTADRVTRGWTRIVPGACETAIATPLTARAYYLYARTSQAHSGPTHAWGGQTPMCVKDTDFALRAPLAATRCESDDTFALPFTRIETNGATSWTATFRQSPPLVSAEAARKAGVDRLLGDIGYKTGRGAQGSAKGTADALQQFRIRMKLPDTAGPGDLFDALETEALKVAAPEGYSVCNDTDGPFWAALGLRQGKLWFSRGWWKVMPGACAKAITGALSAEAIYLFVEGKANRQLVRGKTNFCVTNITFEIQSRDRCAARGLTDRGFATTVTKGLTGFAAHVSEDGLLPPPRLPH